MSKRKVLISKNAYDRMQDNKHMLEFKEKYNFNDRYEALGELGESTHGTIYRTVKSGTINKTGGGISFAAKPYRYTEKTQTIGYHKDFVEIDLLSRIEHPNILKISDIVYCKKKDSVYTISGVYSYDLITYVQNRLPFNDTVRIAHEVISTVKFLYDQGMILPDLNIGMFKMLSINPNSCVLTKLKNIVRHDVKLTYADIYNNMTNFMPPEILKNSNDKFNNFCEYVDKDTKLTKTRRLQYMMFMLGMVLFGIFLPERYIKIFDINDIYDLMDIINSGAVISSRLPDDINQVLRYCLHYDPNRRHSSFEKILEYDSFSSLGFTNFNGGTNYVLPVSVDNIPTEYFMKNCDQSDKIEEFVHNNKLSTFVLGNSLALYIRLLSMHKTNKLPVQSDNILCANKACIALAMTNLIDGGESISFDLIYKHFFVTDKYYNQILCDLFYHICFIRGITMESTYYYSPNYQVFYKTLSYYNKGATSKILMQNSSPDNFVSNMIKNHIVTAPLSKYRIYTSGPVEDIFSPVKYVINTGGSTPEDDVPDDTSKNAENDVKNESNTKPTRTKKSTRGRRKA